MEKYCEENELTLNTDKTKCMIFNKTGRLLRTKFHFNRIPLENVREFKYLGFMLTPSGEINSGLQDLRDRALKAFYKSKKLKLRLFHNQYQLHNSSIRWEG